jgi:branched-chain amino acid transport system permease protein
MVVAFALGGALAGVAGGLIAPDTSVLPSMGGSPLLLAFVAIVVGGMGDIRGTLVAALAVGMVQSIVSTYWDPAAATWVAFSLVLVVLIFRSRRDLAYA